MDIFDKTAALAVSIKESAEYSEFFETKSEIELTPKAKEVLKEYRARQFALELAEIAGDGVDEVNDALAEICEVMEEDKLLSKYLTAEYNLCCLMQRIQEIFAEQLEISIENNIIESDGIEKTGFLN
jgi:cell fate (sporulation/competence/biofilm development) regulator YlbF (YheA/YmcA/DUF963 family)